MKFLVNNDELFDIVFLNPPFGTNLLEDSLKIMEKKTLKDDSLIYIEGERGLRSPEVGRIEKNRIVKMLTLCYEKSQLIK